jgi:23S rRNA (cytidine1920-2'-O)/16S rRNA (cytidine1409-2'-O)-methyltransferase
VPRTAGARPGGRERLDRLLVDRGHARSRERAQALVLAGRVRVDGKPAGKPGAPVPRAASIVVVEPDHPFVGRGGVKLDGALQRLAIDPRGRVVLDIGASTGGFTDCVLRRGAARVFALDVGAGLLDWTLRNDARVVVLEGRNARHLTPADLPGRADLVVMDVSFISLRLILPVVPALLAPGGAIIALVKPQFEVGRREVGRGGIVRDPRLHRAALESVAAAAQALGLAVRGGCPSPIAGAEGNREFFLHLEPGEATDAPALAELLGGIVDERQPEAPPD